MNPLFLLTSEQTCFWRKLTAQGASHPPGPTCSRTSLTIFPPPRLLPTPPRSVLRTKHPSPPQETQAHRAPFSEPSSRVAPQFPAEFPSVCSGPSACPPLPPAPTHSSDPRLCPVPREELRSTPVALHGSPPWGLCHCSLQSLPRRLTGLSLAPGPHAVASLLLVWWRFCSSISPASLGLLLLLQGLKASALLAVPLGTGVLIPLNPLIHAAMQIPSCR